MKRKISLVLGLAACLFGSLWFTSCEPDDVDDFAAGYRYGYESQQHNDDDDDKGIPQDGFTIDENK